MSDKHDSKRFEIGRLVVYVNQEGDLVFTIGDETQKADSQEALDLSDWIALRV